MAHWPPFLEGLLRPGIGLAARMQVCCWAAAARHCAVYLIDMQSHFALPATGSQGDKLLITMPLHKPSSDLSGLLHKHTQNKHADPLTTWCSSDVPRSTCTQMSCQLLPGSAVLHFSPRTLGLHGRSMHRMMAAGSPLVPHHAIKPQPHAHIAMLSGRRRSRALQQSAYFLLSPARRHMHSDWDPTSCGSGPSVASSNSGNRPSLQ